jgi:N6-adenosine-specific RNA methylase IME4
MLIAFPNKKYQIIYADPPWEYKQSGSKTNSRGMAKQHYPTMSTKDICNLPIDRIKTDSTILFMWATFPNMGEALKVIDAWGFEYKTAAFVWVKKNKKNTNTNFWGMGAYTRANAEVCLLAVSKNTKASKQVLRHDIHQIIEAPIERHSKKPDIVRDKITQLGGEVPSIELFAREHISGWDCWGNEVNLQENEQAI